MNSLPSSVSIFLAASCLSSVTSSGSEGFKTETYVTVTPVDGTHLKLDYQKYYHKYVNLDYYQIENVMITIKVNV